jgi:hypothetical protein
MADMRRAHQLDVTYQLAYQNQITTPIVVDLPRSAADQGNAHERQVAEVASDNATTARDLERRFAGSDDVERRQSSGDLATHSWTRTVPGPRPASQSFGAALAHPESKTANNNGNPSKGRASLFDRWLESVKQSPVQTGTEDLDEPANAELPSNGEEEKAPELGDDDKNPRRRIHGWNYDLSGSPLIRLRDHPAATGIQSNNPDNDEENLVPRGRFGLQQGSFFTGLARLNPSEEPADVGPAPRIRTTGIRNGTSGLDLARPGASPVPRALTPLDLRRPAAAYLPPLRRPTTGISTSP